MCQYHPALSFWILKLFLFPCPGTLHQLSLNLLPPSLLQPIAPSSLTYTFHFCLSKNPPLPTPTPNLGLYPKVSSLVPHGFSFVGYTTEKKTHVLFPGCFYHLARQIVHMVIKYTILSNYDRLQSQNIYQPTLGKDQ